MAQMTATATDEKPAPRAQRLTVAHSPDSDDAFMFYALATRKITTAGLAFEHTLEDIETLNRKALEGVYDITAVSFHAYAHLGAGYVLLPSGASFGDGYGPVVVTKRSLGPKGIKDRRVAVPGKLTTAYLMLRLYEPDFEAVETPFDKIFEAVSDGAVDAGVVIHEGQLTYGQARLRKLVDLGEWWHEHTGLPLPLGGNVIRRSLGAQVIGEVSRLLRSSIEYALEHREEALSYALQFARGLDPVAADEFIARYVNDWTLDYGERGREAVQTLLTRGFEARIIPAQVKAEFAS